MPMPCKPPQYGVLALDSEGIAAAAWFEFDTDLWWINVMAVALRWRRSAQHLGDDLMEHVFDRIIERADEQRYADQLSISTVTVA
jgi:hypothetical protein